MTSTGKARVHGNGVQAATVCIQPGSTASGANCPPKKVNREKKTAFIADTLVSQKADRATHHSTTNRSAVASSSAGTKATTARAEVSDRSASKARPSATAAGRMPTSPTSL